MSGNCDEERSGNTGVHTNPAKYQPETSTSIHGRNTAGNKRTSDKQTIISKMRVKIYISIGLFTKMHKFYHLIHDLKFTLTINIYSNIFCEKSCCFFTCHSELTCYVS
jgi:hypothetical protein